MGSALRGRLAAVLLHHLGGHDLARPIAAPPNVAPERLAVLRSAFDAPLLDPELLSEAERLKLDIELVSGVELESLIKRLYESPEAVITRVRDALGGSLKAD